MSFDVAIIGAGLAGLSSAHFLQKAGYSVCVIDAENEVAAGASYANGGLLTPSMPDPWNAPGVQWDLLRWLGKKDAPMLLKPSALWAYIGWGLRFIGAANARDYQAAIEANFLLSQYSLQETEALRQELGLEYDAVQSGALKVWRDAQGLEKGRLAAEALAAHGMHYKVLTVEQVIAREPLLANAADRISGGIHYQQDTRGNAWKFCQQLRAKLAQAGVEFLLGQSAQKILLEQGKVAAVQTSQGRIACSKVVVAAGAFSAPLLADLSVFCPVRPVKGYSLSVPLTDPQKMPQLPIIDDALHAAVTPLGDHVRVAGTAEFSAWNRQLDPARVDNLWDLLRAVTPAAAAVADVDAAKPWCGLRPVSADGKPLIGESHINGLYLNTGHGHLGWTQAVGSARLLCAAMTQTKPEINAQPYAAQAHKRKKP